MTRERQETRPGGPPPGSDNPVVTAAAYIALLLLGAVEALIGTFQFGRGPGVLAAVCFALAMLATCILGAWGMQSGAGGVLPAVGWFVVALVLGTTGRGGSVFVTNSASGKWFLFGGAICSAAGAIVGYAKWSVAGHRRGA